jgi:hypothetical protein
MAMTRRAFVSASAFAALGALAGRALGRVDAAAAAAAPVLRPAAAGSSSAVCGRCGSPAHTTLGGACADGAEARRAVQRSARRLTRAAHAGEERGGA